MKSFALVLVLAFALAVSADNWAVLVAGSAGWSNYRHQADVHHAYHLLVNNGFNPSNIIVMVKNDIANNSQNPFPGQIYNAPSDGEGVDVYAGTQINYSGSDVTKDSFLQVLSTLQSTQNDNVFVFYSDHGNTGILAMPDESILYADELKQTVESMKANGQFNEMVFYLEACHSGSMFEDINVDGFYGLAASGPHENSAGCYCPGYGSNAQDIVNGTELNTCLGDLFAVNWMNDAENQGVSESFQTNYEHVKDATTASHVTAYGDQNIMSEPIGNFIAGSNKFNRLRKIHKKAPKSTSHWNQYDNDLNLLINKFAKTKSAKDFINLQNEYISRNYYESKFSLIQQSLGVTRPEGHLHKNHEGFRTLVNTFKQNCGKLTDYALSHLHILGYVADQYKNDIDTAKAHVKLVCSH